MRQSIDENGLLLFGPNEGPHEKSAPRENPAYYRNSRNKACEPHRKVDVDQWSSTDRRSTIGRPERSRAHEEPCSDCFSNRSEG